MAEPFKVHILGCGSALPTLRHYASSQVVEVRDHVLMLDCSEGTQMQLRKSRVRFTKLSHVFITHLHGDHCFGLIGLISTLSMMHRTQPLHIYAHADLEKLLQPMLDYHCQELSFEVIFHHINPRKQEVIFEDRTVVVETVPLKHKVPTCGFLFTERHRRLNAETGEFYHEQAKRYAYITDTMYSEKIVPIIEGVDMLFHEATYTEQYADRCRGTMHSTAKQAAAIAQLANSKQLLIGHFSAREDDHNVFLREAQEIFPNTQLAVERTTIEF
jgi:Metal-dependent hydrolases of the beta-lactamase superfamily III